MSSLCLLLSLTVLATSCCTELDWHYHNNTELEHFLKNFSKITTDGLRAKLYSIGTTKKRNRLWVVQMTAAKQGRIGVPNVKLIGTVHGNEPVGREIILHFMEYLRKNYKRDETITWLLENTRIHFLPNLNPEGFALSNENMCTGEHVRNNGLNGKDLNRNFPDFYHLSKIPEEPETKAVKKWLTDVPFILSAALHGGALVVNYPFDTVKELTSYATNPPSITPDNDVFKHLATVYARNHPMMGNETCDLSKFENGITNGAAWYPIIGGMQDYNYAFHGCMELTLEISCCKYPIWKELPKLWEQNKMALVKFCAEALRGITGQILDGVTGKPVIGAALRIVGRNMTFYSHKTGEFWRLLLPGRYKLEVSAQDYYKQVVSFIVENSTDVTPQLNFLNVYLLNSTVSTTRAPTTEPKTIETVTEFTTVSQDGVPTADSDVGVDFIGPKAKSLTVCCGESSSTQTGLPVFVPHFYVVVMYCITSVF